MNGNTSQSKKPRPPAPTLSPTETHELEFAESLEKTGRDLIPDSQLLPTASAMRLAQAAEGKVKAPDPFFQNQNEDSPSPEHFENKDLIALQSLMEKKLGLVLSDNQINALSQDPAAVSALLGEVQGTDFNPRDPQAAQNISDFARNTLGLALDPQQEIQIAQHIEAVEADFVLDLTDKKETPENTPDPMKSPAELAASNSVSPTFSAAPEPEAAPDPDLKPAVAPAFSPSLEAAPPVDHLAHPEGPSELGENAPPPQPEANTTGISPAPVSSGENKIAPASKPNTSAPGAAPAATGQSADSLLSDATGATHANTPIQPISPPPSTPTASAPAPAPQSAESAADDLLGVTKMEMPPDSAGPPASIFGGPKPTGPAKSAEKEEDTSPSPFSDPTKSMRSPF